MKYLLLIENGFNEGITRKSKIVENVKETEKLMFGIYGIGKIYAVNIALALVIYLIFGFNIPVFIGTFVLSDIISIGLERLFLYYYPQKILPNLSLQQAEKRLEAAEKYLHKMEDLEGMLYERFCTTCGSCSYSTNRKTCSDCTEKSIVMQKISRLEAVIRAEEKRIKKLKEEETKVFLQKDTKKSADYDDKVQYFETTKQKIDYLIEQENLSFLKQLKTSITNLIDVALKRENGIMLIPRTTYLYLDEMQKIINKVVILADEQKDAYLENIEKISNALTDNINETIERIEKSDAEDIDVGIAVLMQELLNENKKEDKQDV